MQLLLTRVYSDTLFVSGDTLVSVEPNYSSVQVGEVQGVQGALPPTWGDDLIEATFDLYPHLLYQSLHWHLPSDPKKEQRVGQQLTEYLWRGF